MRGTIGLDDVFCGRMYHFYSVFIRHIGLLEADEDYIRKIRPKGTQVRMLYVPREAIRP